MCVLCLCVLCNGSANGMWLKHVFLTTDNICSDGHIFFPCAPHQIRLALKLPPPLSSTLLFRVRNLREMVDVTRALPVAALLQTTLLTACVFLAALFVPEILLHNYDQIFHLSEKFVAQKQMTWLGNAACFVWKACRFWGFAVADFFTSLFFFAAFTSRCRPVDRIWTQHLLCKYLLTITVNAWTANVHLSHGRTLLTTMVLVRDQTYMNKGSLRMFPTQWNITAMSHMC